MLKKISNAFIVFEETCLQNHNYVMLLHEVIRNVQSCFAGFLSVIPTILEYSNYTHYYHIIIPRYYCMLLQIKDLYVM